MKGKRFRHAITIIGEWLGHPMTFALVTLYGLGWVMFAGRGIDWHGVATMATLYLTLIILRTDRRDTEALHAKLDELLRALEGPDEALADIDQREPEEIVRIREGRRDPERGQNLDPT
jgi:low affinity Fe/Cu permease